MKNLRNPLLIASLVSGLSFGAAIGYCNDDKALVPPVNVLGADSQAAMIEALKKAGLPEEEIERVKKSLESMKVQVQELSGNTEKLKEQAEKHAKNLKDRKEVNGDGDATEEVDSEDLEVIDLSELNGGQNFAFRINRGQLAGINRFRIGVQCKVEKDDSGNSVVSAGSVMEGTPAAKAGVLKDDVISKINDQPIDSVEELVKQVQKAGEEGKELKFEVKRGVEVKEIALKPDRVDSAETLSRSLAIPNPQFSGGWIINNGRLMPGAGINFAQPVVPNVGPSNEELREDIHRIEKEIQEIKSMIKELSNK